MENGWVHHIINPDGHSQTSDGSAEVDYKCFSTDSWLENN